MIKSDGEIDSHLTHVYLWGRLTFYCWIWDLAFTLHSYNKNRRTVNVKFVTCFRLLRTHGFSADVDGPISSVRVRWAAHQLIPGSLPALESCFILRHKYVYTSPHCCVDFQRLLNTNLVLARVILIFK